MESCIFDAANVAEKPVLHRRCFHFLSNPYRHMGVGIFFAVMDAKNHVLLMVSAEKHSFSEKGIYFEREDFAGTVKINK